jgi:hypothetical protein
LSLRIPRRLDAGPGPSHAAAAKSVSVANVEVRPSRGVSADDNRRALVHKCATRWSSRTENASESVNRNVTVTDGVPVQLGPAGMRPYRDQAGTARYSLPGTSHLPLTRHETLERPGVSASHLGVSASHLGVSASHLGVSAVCRAQGPGPATPVAPRQGGTVAERLLLAQPGSESGRRPPRGRRHARRRRRGGRRRRLTVASVSARV